MGGKKIKILLTLFLLTLSCAPAILPGGIEKSAFTMSNRKTLGTEIRKVDFGSAASPVSSDCVFKKEYITQSLSEDRQDIGRSIAGMWKTERVKSLTYLPKDSLGNYPDWVAAVEKNIINPRGTIDFNKPEIKEYQPDVLMIVKSPVRNNICFPHSVHAYWLGCNNCHPEIFIAKKDANPINMTKIIKGKFCGRCHGIVAFHVANNCFRCHNTPK